MTTTDTITLTARDPGDLVAMAPVVLGFVPTDSLVMLSFGTGQMHVRVDLPTRGEVAAASAAIVGPALRNRVSRVVFVIYTDDVVLAKRLRRQLCEDFGRAGIEVLEVIRVHDGRWFTPWASPHGVPVDVGAHRITAEAVAHGNPVLASRSELAAQVGPDVVQAGLVAAATPVLFGDYRDDAAVAAFRDWLDGLVRRGTALDHTEVATMVRQICQGPFRDAAWVANSGPCSEEEIRIWIQALRWAPPHLVVHTAGVVAMLAWRRGNGALAWCAIDRVDPAEATTGLVGLVAQLLDTATPPDSLPLTWPGGGVDEP